MGKSLTSAEFVKKINDLGHATDRNRRTAVNLGAFEAKKTLIAAAGAKGLTPGGKIAKRRWNVRYDVKGTETPTALVRFTGPVHLVNSDTRSHPITPKGRGRRGKKALAFNGRAYAAVRHPGTTGKHFFEAGKVAANRTVPRVMADSMKGAWGRVVK